MTKKIVVPPVVDTELDVNVFSDKINQVLNNVKITDNGDGTELVELSLDGRVVTFIIDQSGSMTWNDNDGFRHEIAKKIIEDIEANYPGEIRYNLFQYGAILSTTLFFGVIEEDGFNPNDIDSLNALYFADDEANFAGIRVVRNIERVVDGDILTYPTSPIDGEIVLEGFISKAFEDSLEEGTTYYYTVYTFDKELRFSRGRNVSVAPRDRIVPRGVSIFNSFKKIDETSLSLIGSAVQRDEDIIGLWHMDEGEGHRLFDFSDTKANLTLFDTEPSWVGENFSPAGEGAMYFNGVDDYATINDVDALDLGTPKTLMAWILPYSVSGSSDIICSTDGEDVSYTLGIRDGKLFFSEGIPGTGSSEWSTDSAVIEVNAWQHVCVTLLSGSPIFYINANIEPSSTTSSGPQSSNDGNLYFSIGACRRTSGIMNYFYGKITEVSVHGVVRDSDYISNQVSVEEVIDPDTGIAFTDPLTGLPATQALGLKGDNGDRLNVFKYTVPEDANYLGGEVIIVKNEKNIPTWEGDGTIIHTNTSVSSGEYFSTDADDFVLGEEYYYRIYSQNTTGNFSYSSDSPSLSIDISTGILPEYIPELLTNIEGPSNPFGVPVSVGGNRKVGLRWRNDLISDDRVKRVKIYVSTSLFPTVNPDGGSSGSLIFTGDVSDGSFVHRDISNDIERFYTITNIDRYGRNSSAQITSSSTTSASSTSAQEALIPLLEVENLHYEIVNDESVSIIWDQPIQRPEDLHSFFGETVLLYATITDQFGQPIPEDSLVEMVIESKITKETAVDDVFSSGEPLSFTDEESYSFVVSGIKDGIIQASLSMSNDSSVLSQIKEAKFTVKVKSFIPGNSSNLNNSSDGQASSNVSSSALGAIADYINTINELIEDIEGAEEEVESSGNIFEYTSQPLNIVFSNPWDLELVNRDNRKVEQRCFYYKKDTTTNVDVLTQTVESFDGAYIRSTNPFVARAKVTYKGDVVSSGFVDIAVWDAEADLCSCATEDADPGCKPVFSKTQVSEIVSLPSYRLPIINGTENTVNSVGETVSTPISYIDVSLSSTDLPLNIKLYAKGQFAGFSSLKELDIVFQNILRIDLNAQAPQADGVNIVEQQSTVYIINPDFPENQDLYTFPVNQSIVEWKIDPKHAFRSRSIGGGSLTGLTGVDIIPRNLYSIDNVPVFNGIFSYTRTGTARNVFLGPAENRNESIAETYELSASISYEGLSDQSKQEIIISHGGSNLQSFGARFLMETEYSYKNARGNRIWTDGIDYKKIYISRDPTVADYPEFLFGDIFRNCADEEGSPVLELNPSGQVVTLIGDEDIEFLWGEITEVVDPYTGQEYLEIGDDGFIASGTADVELNDESISDRTTVYFRFNKFTQGSKCNRDNTPPCREVNLGCLGLTSCDLPLGNSFISGETFIFVNGEPLRLAGGGGDSGGVPPCPVCFNEPLRVSTVWTKIDGKDTPELGVFPEPEFGVPPKDPITVNSVMDIRVEVSFAGKPVPNNTPITTVVGNNDGRSVFSALRNIVFTEIQDTDVIDEYTGDIVVEADGKSYADIRIVILNVPEVTSSEKIKIFSTYDETELTERKVENIYSMTLIIKDIPDEEEEEDVPDVIVPPEEEQTVYSKTLERYDIDLDQWSYSTDMSIARSSPFVGVVNNIVYVFGGFINNDTDIAPETEVYYPLTDSWSFASDIPTPRFGGSTVVVEDKIYTIGGCYYNDQQQNIEVSNLIEMYDTTTGEWSTLTDMPSVGIGISEQSYGVAYGTAVHVALETGSDIFNYIYVLSGAIEVYDGNSGIEIEAVNDRILRYCIETDSWEISSIPLFGSDLNTYQRISPLCFSVDNQIVVLNGALVDLSTTVNEFVFINEVYTITVVGDIDLTDFISSSFIGTKPLAKYQSSLVEYLPNPAYEPSSSLQRFYFIIGGANQDSLNLDIVERLDPSVQPYGYTNSELSLDSLSKGRNALGAAFAYGLDDEYGSISPFIYVMGGKTSGNEDGSIEIGFGD
jgi:hypothetical protein